MLNNYFTEYISDGREYQYAKRSVEEIKHFTGLTFNFTNFFTSYWLEITNFIIIVTGCIYIK